MITGQKGITAGQLLTTETLIVDPDRLERLLVMRPAWVRLPMRVGTRATGWDAQLLTAQAQLAGILRDHGIQVIALVYDETVPGALQADWDHADPAKQSAFVQRFVEQVKPIHQALYWVQCWEIWNEPNNYQVYGPKGGVSGGTGISPPNYLRLLTATSGALKSTNKAVQVITGGVVSHNIHGVMSTANAGIDYLAQVYSLNGKKAPANGIGIHLYLDQPGHLAPEHMQQYLVLYAGMFGRYEGLGALRDVYVTEMGWETPNGGPVTDLIQASNLITAYTTLGNNVNVKAACWYSLEDGNGKWGLYDPNGKPKAAASAFAALL